MKPTTTTGDSMTGSVLDILIYVFDQYMLAEVPEVPERETLAADLERAGFGRHNVERALDWLADLAGERSRPDIRSHAAARCASSRTRSWNAFRPTAADTCCSSSARASSRRCSARSSSIGWSRCDSDEVDIDRLKWLVLMVLSSQPGQEQACARMEDLVFDEPDSLPN